MNVFAKYTKSRKFFRSKIITFVNAIINFCFCYFPGNCSSVKRVLIMAKCDSKFDSKCKELLKILPELQCFKCKDVPGPKQDQKNRYICFNESHNLCEKDKVQCPCGSNVGKSPSPLVAKLLQDLPWMCKNFKSGCREIKENTEELEKHQRNCIYRQIFCPDFSCKEDLLFLDVEYHLTTVHKNMIEIKADYVQDHELNTTGPGNVKQKLLKWNCHYNSNFEHSEMTWGLYKVTTSDGDVFFQSAYFNNRTFYAWTYFFGSVDERNVYLSRHMVKSKLGEVFIYHGYPLRLDMPKNKIIVADLTFKIGVFAARRSLDDNGNLNVETIVFKKVEDKNVEPSSNINLTTGFEEQVITGPAASSTTSSDTSPTPGTSGVAKVKTNSTEPSFNLKTKEEIKVEVKTEISDGFSIEEQSALEIVEDLPMPKKQKLAK